jgi:putative flippase GtrA
MHEALKPAGRRGELFRFIVVGVGSNALGYGLYLLVTYLGVPPKAAMSLMYAIGVGTGFVGNWRYTFGSRTGLRHAAPRYLAAHLLGYLVNFGIHLLGDRFGFPHQLSQAVGICVVAALLFVLFRHFVFPRPTGPVYR